MKQEKAHERLFALLIVPAMVAGIVLFWIGELFMCALEIIAEFLAHIKRQGLHLGAVWVLALPVLFLPAFAAGLLGPQPKGE